jgi:hypothetical protein
MARIIPDTAAMDAENARDLPFRVFGHRFAKRDESLPPRVHAPPSEYIHELFPGSGVQELGKGVHGQTFAVKVTAKFRGQLCDALRAMANVLDVRPPRLGSEIVIKLAHFRAVREVMQEAAAHRHLYEYPSVQIGVGSCAQRLRARSYVPRFYAFATDTRTGLAMTVMARIEGAVELRYVQRTLCADVFLRIEKAFLAFAVSGVEHSDAHFANVMVKPDGHPYIIDFGFSVRLPERARKSFVEFASRAGSSLELNAALKAFALRHVNAVQWKRFGGRLSFYNPTHSALRLLWKRMPESQRRLLSESARRYPVMACLYAKKRT